MQKTSYYEFIFLATKQFGITRNLSDVIRRNTFVALRQADSIHLDFVWILTEINQGPSAMSTTLRSGLSE